MRVTTPGEPVARRLGHDRPVLAGSPALGEEAGDIRPADQPLAARGPLGRQPAIVCPPPDRLRADAQDLRRLTQAQELVITSDSSVIMHGSIVQVAPHVYEERPPAERARRAGRARRYDLAGQSRRQWRPRVQFGVRQDR